MRFEAILIDNDTQFYQKKENPSEIAEAINIMRISVLGLVSCTWTYCNHSSSIRTVWQNFVLEEGLPEFPDSSLL
jgi:hypothetical protein